MKYCLFTPIKVSPNHNAGWHMITAGIKYLIKQFDKNAEFESVSMFDWPRDRDFSENKPDLLVLCGNPRYDESDSDSDWLYFGLLSKMKKLQIPILDAWQGSGGSLGLDISELVENLSGNNRNKKIISLLNGEKVITRDKVSQKINEKNNLNSVLLPCSSFWAANEYGISSNNNKTEKIVVVYRMEGYSDIRGILNTISRTHRIIATSSYDSAWCDSIDLEHDFIYDPIELLNLYSVCSEVISYRLHAVIPAVSVGASVYMCAIDSRAMACDLFGIPYGDYRDGIKRSSIVEKIKIPDLKEVLGC